MHHTVVTCLIYEEPGLETSITGICLHMVSFTDHSPPLYNIFSRFQFV